MLIGAKILVIILGLAGFILADYIRRTKNNTALLICPLEGSCETVINSKYSKLFGVPLEYWGMTYYGIIALSYTILLIMLPSIPESIYMSILGLTVVAFAFSMYLTAIQAIVLKHWCTWCLFSAAICTSIFILVIFILNTSIEAPEESWFSLI